VNANGTVKELGDCRDGTVTFKKKIAVAVPRGGNDYGDQETDVTRTQNKSRQLVATRKCGSMGLPTPVPY